MLKTKSGIVKVMLIILAAIMMISVVGCNGTEKPDSTAGSNAKATASASIEQGDTETTETASATVEADETATLQESATAEAENTPSNSATATATVKPTATPGGSSSLTNATVGEVIKFGHYEQDNDTSNGKEEIEWIVLAKEGNKALVTSKYVLAAKAYNDTYTNVTWETCTLRTWLNGTFLNDAFSSAEQSKIATTTVVNNDNPTYGTEGGNNTQDKVFLLSIEEVNTYFTSDEARELQGTAYAKADNLWTSISSSYSSNCVWWLRSPGSDSRGAVFVNYGGYAGNSGKNVDDDLCGVRPALWINL